MVLNFSKMHMWPHLRLDGVEVGESVHLLVLRAVQCGKGERVKVQQLCVGRVLLRENQAPEGQREDGLRAQPGVGHHPA